MGESWDLDVTRHTTLQELRNQTLSRREELAYTGLDFVWGSTSISSEEHWQAAFRESTVLPLRFEVRLSAAVILDTPGTSWFEWRHPHDLLKHLLTHL